MNENEEVGRLERELAEIKRSQAGSDKMVTELQKEKEQLNADWQKRFADVKKEKESTNERLKALESGTDLKRSNLERRERVLSLAVEKGIDPKEVFNLLGLNEEMDDEDRLDSMISREDEIRMDERDKFAKRSGRRVQTGLLQTTPNYQDMLSMSNADIKALGPQAVNMATDRELAANKRTVKKQLWEALS